MKIEREEHVEGALLAKSQQAKNYKKNNLTSNQITANNYYKEKGEKKNYPSCHNRDKMGHPPFRCWKKPDGICIKCNQTG